MAASLFDFGAKSRAQRERLRGLFANPPHPEEEEDEAQGLFPGGDHTDIADRGAHRAGLRDAPLSELPGALMTAAGIAMGGFPAVVGAGMKASGYSPMDMMMNGLGWGGQQSMAGVPGLGIQDGQMSMMSPELQGRNDPSQMGGVAPGVDLDALDLDNATSMGESPGLYHKSGKVGPKSLFAGDPPGPDNVIIGAKVGERIINDETFNGFSEPTRKEIDAALKKAKRK